MRGVLGDKCQPASAPKNPWLFRFQPHASRPRSPAPSRHRAPLLQLELTAEDVRHSLLAAPKLRLKPACIV